MSTERVTKAREATEAIAEADANVATPEAVARAESAMSHTVRVDADGRVRIPDTAPGDLVTLTITEQTTTAPRRVLTPDEIEAAVQRTLEGARKVREAASPEWLALDHGEWLYDENGLPK